MVLASVLELELEWEWELVTVVQETVQPDRVGVWVRPG